MIRIDKYHSNEDEATRICATCSLTTKTFSNCVECPPFVILTIALSPGFVLLTRIETPLNLATPTHLCPSVNRDNIFFSDAYRSPEETSILQNDYLSSNLFRNSLVSSSAKTIQSLGIIALIAK